MASSKRINSTLGFPIAVALGVLVGVLTYSLWLRPVVEQRGYNRSVYRNLSDELRPILARFGEPKYSSHYEETLVRDFFGDERNGVFVDVGASHYRDRSNTYYLEEELGWTGIAIDPITAFEEDYRQHRPNTRFFALFVSDTSDDRAKLYVGRQSLYSSAHVEHTDHFTDVAQTVEVPTITLNDLFAAQGVTKLDFLSVDVELHEPQVLKGLDLTRYRPRLVCIEAFPPVREYIIDYFARRGYVIVAKYLRADPLNLWFTPLAPDPASN